MNHIRCCSSPYPSPNTTPTPPTDLNPPIWSIISIHGGLSTGALTPEGLQHISEANLNHGRQTKDKLAVQRHAANVGRRVCGELKRIERQIVDAGLMIEVATRVVVGDNLYNRLTNHSRLLVLREVFGLCPMSIPRSCNKPFTSHSDNGNWTYIITATRMISGDALK